MISEPEGCSGPAIRRSPERERYAPPWIKRGDEPSVVKKFGWIFGCGKNAGSPFYPK
jgi:hypothetical protein